MSKTGAKGSHLQLIDAVAEVKPTASSCGGRTKAGGECKKPLGQGTEHAGVGQCWHHDGQVEEGAPCPLPLDALERRMWDVITTQLRNLRLENQAFWPHKFGLVVALAGLHTARQQARVGSTVKGDNSHVKKHPSSTVVNQMLAHIRQFSNDLGLNPSALASMNLDDPDRPLSDMEKLIRGRR